MKTTKQYLQFIAELKQSIIQSRYHTARLANREQLLLYLKTGKMLVQKIDAKKWGAKVITKYLRPTKATSWSKRILAQKPHENEAILFRIPISYNCAIKPQSNSINEQLFMLSATVQMNPDGFEAVWLVSLVIISFC